MINKKITILSLLLSILTISCKWDWAPAKVGEDLFLFVNFFFAGVLGLTFNEKFNGVIGIMVAIIVFLAGVYIISHHIIPTETLQIMGGIGFVICIICIILMKIFW